MCANVPALASLTLQLFHREALEQERSKGDQLVTKIAHERAEDRAARRIQAFFKQVLVDVECKYMLPFCFVCRCAVCAVIHSPVLLFACCVTSTLTVKDAKKGAKLAMGALSRFGSKAGLDFTGKASRASMSSLVAPLAAAAPTKPPPHVRGFLYKKGFTGLKKWQVINKPLVGCQVFLTVMCVFAPLSHDDDSAATMCFARATCRFGAAKRSMMLASHQHRDLPSLYLDTGCKRYHARSGFVCSNTLSYVHVLFCFGSCRRRMSSSSRWCPRTRLTSIHAWRLTQRALQTLQSPSRCPSQSTPSSSRQCRLPHDVHGVQ